MGFELEFANVGIEESAELVQQLYGGKHVTEHRFSHKIVGTPIGDFSIKIDLKLLNEKTYQIPFNKLHINLKDIKIGDETLEDEVETALENLVKTVIPYEITTPPVPVTALEQFEKLRQALFEHKAEGTEAFLTNAFATHINPEVPDTKPETILAYLKAFLLLYPLLLENGKTDLARRVTSFINPFPQEYCKLVLNPSYLPDLNNLIVDYHRYNPDRNRPLDLYPLFAALNPDLVDTFEDLGNVKKRETFHYRLPNSLISTAEWTLAREWNNWVLVEELANKPDTIKEMSQAYAKLKDDTLIGFESKWAKQTKQWVC
ncbi:MAG: amidoligase family protein [Hymenobacteraceae bacterium]|nr:amidoligase family protein [Hymenobacteraceae bacterium]MDX5396916.1 amidoligase family protein [Hymenobacteraceae bacterium]MDX5512990.1 amidoligase family protein [Hymenobacteraceae bacterium]